MGDKSAGLMTLVAVGGRGSASLTGEAGRTSVRMFMVLREGQVVVVWLGIALGLGWDVELCKGETADSDFRPDEDADRNRFIPSDT